MKPEGRILPRTFTLNASTSPSWPSIDLMVRASIGAFCGIYLYPVALSEKLGVKANLFGS